MRTFTCRSTFLYGTGYNEITIVGHTDYISRLCRLTRVIYGHVCEVHWLIF
jgi:hypothetical protein